MKSFLKSALSIGCIFLLSTCTTDKKESLNQIITGFPPAVTLNGTKAFQQEFGIYYLKSIDSLIVISTGQDTLFHIYNTSGKQIYSFGEVGKGPKEFAEATLIYDANKENGTINLFADNPDLLKSSKINLNKSKEMDGIVVDAEYEFPAELRGIDNVYYINEDTLAGIYSDNFYKKLDGKWGGFYYYPKTKKLETFSLLNLTLEPYELMPAINLNSRLSSLAPNRKKMAVVNVHAPVLEVIEIGAKQPIKYYLGFKPSTFTYNLDDFKNDKVTQYYTFVATTNKYIYLLYANHAYTTEKMEAKIQVIDWDGNPKAEYVIPKEYDLGMFTVDENDSVIYGLSYSNDSIYTFNFGEKSEG
jgi:hypothetical protein